MRRHTPLIRPRISKYQKIPRSSPILQLLLYLLTLPKFQTLVKLEPLTIYEFLMNLS